MNRNTSHQKKTVSQIKEYSKAVKKSKSEPTIDKPDNFWDSDDSYSHSKDQLPSTTRRRRLRDQLVDYIENNLISMIVGVIILFIAYLGWDAKIEIAKISEHQNNTDKQLEKVSQDIKEQDSRIDKIELKMQEIYIRFENMVGRKK